jgi:hypothetical protein
VDGNNWLLAYGWDQAAADRARATIRHYGFTEMCFIGRPGPSMTYYLVNHQPPSGSFSGEDCLSHTIADLEVRSVDGKWMITEGSRQIMSFGSSQTEARAALNVIQRHGFTRRCFVKRPNPPMEYFRR